MYNRVPTNTVRLRAEQLEARLAPAVYRVTSTDDTPGLTPTGGTGSAADPFLIGSLRSAVQQANASGADDTIVLPGGTYTLTNLGTGENAAVTGDLDVADTVVGGKLTVTGAGADTTVIDGNRFGVADPALADRVFQVGSGNLTLNNLTVRNAGIAPFSSAYGAIRVHDGTVALNGVTVAGNTLGGVYATGTANVTVDNSRFTSNQFNGDSDGGGGLSVSGGGTGASLLIRNSQFTENSTFYFGGAISLARGTGRIENTLIADNGLGSGGGISTADATLEIVGSTITRNQGSNGGGMAIGGSIVTIIDSTISDNVATGGRYVFETEVSGSGGGIVVFRDTTLTLIRTTVSGNEVRGGDFISANGANAGDALGGGISLPTFSYAPQANRTVVLIQSTVVGNRAVGGSAAAAEPVFYDPHGGDGLGGGIYADGEATLVIRNSTIAGNSATGGAPPPAINDIGSATGGGVYVGASVTPPTVSNTIVAGNTVGGPGTNTDRDVYGAFASAGYNLIGTAGTATGFVNGTAGDLVGTDDAPIDARLGALKDNGDPTLTVALLAGSPAINAGDPNFDPTMLPPPINTDQRGTGFNRVIGGRVDIGATEYQPPATTTTLTTTPNPSQVGQSVTFTATLSANAVGSNTAQGSVTFADGGTILAVVPLTNGVAEFSTAGLTAGAHAITATYSGFTQGDYALAASADTKTQTVHQAPAITSAAAATFTAGSAGSFVVTATGFPAPAFSVSAGGLPPGVTLSPAGVLSGAPTTAGTFTFTITASNGVTPDATQQFTLTVNQVPPSLAGAPPAGQVGSPYIFTFAAAGFPAPTFAVVAGVLPPGLALNPTTGVLRGTPTQAGAFAFTVRAANVAGVADLAVTLSVDAVPPLPPPSVIGLFAVSTGAGGGQVNVYNANGSLRSSLTPFAGFAGGVTVATGDINNDGTADVIIGTTTAFSHVKAFDGASGAELFSFYAFDGFLGGINVATGDVNGDGFADIIVGTAKFASHVKVFDGRTGGLAHSFLAFPNTFGVGVASGDVNGDGFADVVVGAAVGSSLIKVFDGQSGVQILGFEAFAGFTGGVSVAGGDLDGDGGAEVLVGANGNGHVKAFGADGAERLSFLAYPGFGGAAHVGSVDADGNGKFEILAGAGPGAGPHVKRFDGRTLAVLDSFYAFDPSFTGGIFVG